MLKPYTEMKDSGVEWLGEVPAHWEVRKLRRILRSVNKRDRADLPLLSVVREKGIIRRNVSDKDENYNFVPDDLTSYKVVQAGQFVINKMKAWQGSYGVSKFDGIVSPAYYVFDLVGIDAAYFHTAIRSRTYVPCFASASDGVRIGQWDLSQARMREISVLIPPHPEQTAIARFLDHADRNIQRYIQSREQLIALLGELKQSVIQAAVTGRIDVRTGQPYPKMKESGVEWVGEIPSQWVVLPNRALFTEVNEPQHPEEQMLSVTITKGVIPQHELLDETTKKDGSKLDRSAYKLVRPGEIVYNKMRAWQGAIGVSNYKGIVSPAYVVQRLRDEFNPQYLHYLLRTTAFAKEAERWSYGITSDMWSLRPEHFRMIYSCIPSLIEQNAIVDFLDQVSSRMDVSIKLAKREIQLFHEYRTRLIADVVTGKLDVREAVARLPDTDPIDAKANGRSSACESTGAECDEMLVVAKNEDG